MSDTQSVGERLREPFSVSTLGWKPQMVKGNRALAICYIDARDVMDRLDAVVGCENWSDDYTFLAGGQVLCKLSVCINGAWVTKCDVGGESEQPDKGDREKAAVSDALKRAAVKFGIGRYLYSMSSTWCDYDPVKKQFTETPRVAPEFLPRPVDPAEEQARAKLNSAQGLVDLANVWQAMPKILQAKLLGVKDARKAAIVARQRGDQSVISPKPAPEAAPIGPDEVDEHGHPILFDNPPKPTGVPHQ